MEEDKIRQPCRQNCSGFAESGFDLEVGGDRPSFTPVLTFNHHHGRRRSEPNPTHGIQTARFPLVSRWKCHFGDGIVPLQSPQESPFAVLLPSLKTCSKCPTSTARLLRRVTLASGITVSELNEGLPLVTLVGDKGEDVVHILRAVTNEGGFPLIPHDGNTSYLPAFPLKAITIVTTTILPSTLS